MGFPTDVHIAFSNLDSNWWKQELQRALKHFSVYYTLAKLCKRISFFKSCLSNLIRCQHRYKNTLTPNTTYFIVSKCWKAAWVILVDSFRKRTKQKLQPFEWKRVKRQGVLHQTGLKIIYRREGKGEKERARRKKQWLLSWFLHWSLSFETPPFKGHNICSGKNVHTIFVLVTSIACVASVSNPVIARKLEREQKKKKVEGGGGWEKKEETPLFGERVTISRSRNPVLTSLQGTP